MSQLRCHAVSHSGRVPETVEMMFDLVKRVGLSGLEPLTSALFRAVLACGRSA